MAGMKKPVRQETMPICTEGEFLGELSRPEMVDFYAYMNRYEFLVDSIATEPQFRKEILRAASKAVDQELDALDSLNRIKVLKTISEAFDVDQQELWFYIEYGEEECERVFNMLRKAEAAAGESRGV
jgi:acyl-CoA reductase-like NAD-dependent aldehyde dehydrogenase